MQTDLASRLSTANLKLIGDSISYGRFAPKVNKNLAARYEARPFKCLKMSNL